MRLRHIEIFQATLQAGTLTGAARILNITQPAATKLLQHAELQLGFKLFNRVRGRLRITREGRLLQDRVERVFDELRELERLCGSIRQSGHHPLRVVSIPTLATRLVPAAITRIRQEFADASIELVTEHSREMLRSLLVRESDIGLTLQEIHHPGIHQEPLCSAPVRVIAPAGWWDDTGAPIPVDALAGRPMIGIAANDGLGRMLRTHIEHIDPAPEVSIWVQTYQLARSLVADGHGMALVDPFTAMDADTDGIQARILEPRLDVPLYATCREGESLSTIQKRFLKLVKTRLLDELIG
ncbi:LysR family transcriptional regulator [Marilutibacter maris]|uniref:LysR family transcriptional regulator n=1 Tax=Marilutibacter maris TaxID=1605891 RepID=A0A2U9TB94_9GAMM|nr:LysR substrate-binding domain-containing protein [Lysobacter maris]AWV08144.1 LysR family transcriptional regulator [Lysobacter maris]KAB8196197.1 LysR family transcriptional regulator [Lysobacter maris]